MNGLQSTTYAAFIDEIAHQPQHRIRQSVLGREATLCELHDVYEECKSANWDGFGAEPVEQDTYRLAYSIIEALPLNFPRPGIGTDPDGQITMEWYRSANRTLSVSVDPGGFLHYAGIFGSEKSYGSIDVYSDFLPKLTRLVMRVG